MTPAFGLFCNPESRRVEGFCAAAGQRLREHPRLVPWQILLEDRPWEPLLDPMPRFLRLESPGRNWRVEKLLLLRGARATDPESQAWRRIPGSVVSGLENEPGRIHSSRQWFLGWRDTLQGLSGWAGQPALPARWLCTPEDILTMFDKAACQEALEKAGLPVAPSLGIPRSFDDLWQRMRATGYRRIFLKPCHGSSASGVVALEASHDEIQAFSSVELVETPAGTKLYNRRRIQVFRGAGEVRALVEEICPERCLAQVWVPKAGLGGQPLDVRVVVIAGSARHVMVRLGRGPITNSSLLGGKADPSVLRARMGEESWLRMLSVCERAMTECFPRSLYAGIDVLIEPDFRTSRILEVNAFGDLLPWNLHEGRDTYAWEVEESLNLPSQVSAIGS